MECGKVVITRLRNTEYYKGEPLNHIVDSIYHLLDKFIVTYDNEFPHFMDTHNCSLPSREKNNRTIRDYNKIREADTLIIPSENEFSYNISGRMSNIMLGRGWCLVQNLKEALNDNPKPRKIILLTSDKADKVVLYKKVFDGVKNLSWYRIDESEFRGGIHHLKYLAIEKLDLDKTKKVDFGYWGTSKRLKVDYSSEFVKTPIHDFYDRDDWINKGVMTYTGKSSGGILTRYMNRKNPGEELPSYKKQREEGITHPDYPGEPRFYVDLYKGKESKDERHIILKEIYDSKLTNNMIGYFDDFKFTHKFDKKFTNILPFISECNATLCFNWPGQEKHITSRYNEALACDVIPLVWKNYDCDNKLVATDWQRCYSFEDIEKKCLTLRKKSRKLDLLKTIKKKYLESTENLEYYEKEFNNKLYNILED